MVVLVAQALWPCPAAVPCLALLAITTSSLTSTFILNYLRCLHLYLGHINTRTCGSLPLEILNLVHTCLSRWAMLTSQRHPSSLASLTLLVTLAARPHSCNTRPTPTKGSKTFSPLAQPLITLPSKVSFSKPITTKRMINRPTHDTPHKKLSWCLFSFLRPSLLS